MAGALEGIVVADFTRVLAGPYTTMLLGDMGAEVIKVERPGAGDDTRHWGPPFDPAGRATYFEAINRNKSSVAIDMTNDEGLAQAHALAARADIVIHNFPPATAKKFVECVVSANIRKQSFDATKYWMRMAIAKPWSKSAAIEVNHMCGFSN